MTIIAMIPARLGSQRLKQKNLLEINGVPIIRRTIRKLKKMSCFDEIWVNSEADVFKEIAQDEGVLFHKRPAELGNNTATSEDFVTEFLRQHECDYLVQVHSIAPLLKIAEIEAFVEKMLEGNYDTLLSGEQLQIQCMLDDTPLNFSKTNMDATQVLEPVQRISWSITGWKRNSFLSAVDLGNCGTFNGKMGFFSLSATSSLVIKHQSDLDIAIALASSGFGD